jgi:hypothetical protein
VAAPQRVDLLDQEQPSLRASPRLRAIAVDLLVELSLARSATYRLEFDAAGLTKLLGTSGMRMLARDSVGSPAPGRPLDRAEGALEPDRARFLRRLVWFEQQEWRESPLVFIERLVLFEARGRVVLRLGAGGDYVLFALPDRAKAVLLEGYRRAGIPRGVIQEVAVDIARASRTGAAHGRSTRMSSSSDGRDRTRPWSTSSGKERAVRIGPQRIPTHNGAPWMCSNCAALVFRAGSKVPMRPRDWVKKRRRSGRLPYGLAGRTIET